MAKVIYNGVEVNLESGVSPQTALDALKSIYPELANARMTQQGADYVVTVATATKGMAKKAIYGSTQIDIQDGVTLDAVKAALTSIYPELQNSTVSVNGSGDFVFTVATATKGN